MKHLLIFLTLITFKTHASSFDQEWEKVKQDAMAQTVSFNCHGRMGDALGNCDSVAETFYSHFQSEVTTACGKVVTDSCSMTLKNVLFARFAARYPKADFQKADTWCMAHLNTCNMGKWTGADLYELQLAKSHNDAIYEMTKYAHDEIEGRAVMNHLQTQKALLNATTNSGDNATNCVSTYSRNVVHTRCK